MPLIPLGDLLFPEGKWRCNGSEGEVGTGRSREVVICGWDVLYEQINEKGKKKLYYSSKNKNN